MKQTFAFLALIIIAVSSSAQQKSFYDFRAKNIDGDVVDFSVYKGKKVLVVNVASKCGFTPQYEELQKLYEEYGGDDFVIIGFPANNFMGQEPGSNEEIKEFCTKNYGVTFPMMSKISVKGDNIHPLYNWLTMEKLNGVMDAEVKWNFQKFMINEAGQIIDVAYTKESPYSEKIIKWLEE